MATATQYEAMTDKELVEQFDFLIGDNFTGRLHFDELLREMRARLADPQRQARREQTL